MKKIDERILDFYEYNYGTPTEAFVKNDYYEYNLLKDYLDAEIINNNKFIDLYLFILSWDNRFFKLKRVDDNQVLLEVYEKD